MKFKVIFVMAMAVHLASGQFGHLVVRFGEDQSEASFCISYNDTRLKLPSSYNDQDFDPLVDLSPDPLCEVPEDPDVLAGAVLLVSGSSNCTLSERLALAEDLESTGLVVVVKDHGLPFGNTTTNMSVIVYLEEDSYNTLEEILRENSGYDTSAVLYSPEPPKVDPTAVVILVLAIAIVAIGGYWSGLTSFQQYKKKLEKRRREDVAREEGDPQEEEEKQDGSMVVTTTVVVIWVVLIVSFLLLLYFFYNIFVYVVIFMFCIGAWSSLYICLIPVVKQIFRCKARTPVIPLLKTSYSFVSIILTAVCIVPVICWFVYRHEDFAWILQDILGTAFCISMLKSIHLPNFKICVLLLGMLFFYDLFFVFITPLFTNDRESIMVRVATGGEGATEQLPVLFIFPQLTDPACGGLRMLGYGDVLIPGLLVGFCHGFDMKIRSRKVYYIGSTAAYGLGLLLTFVALAVMRTGQPALVYIVPSTLLTVSLIGCVRGDLKALWSGDPTETHRPLGGEINTAVNST